MKKLIPMALTVIFLVTGLAGFNQNEVKNLFLDNPMSGSRFNPVTGKVYGIYRTTKKIRHFASMDAETGKVKRLSPVDETLKFPSGATALDITGHRYFLVVLSGKAYYLYVYNMTTGALLKRHQLKNRLAFIEYHTPTGKLYGFGRIEGMYRFVSVDIESGKIKKIGNQKGFTRLHGRSRKIDEKKGVLLFEGEYKGKKALWGIGLKKGRIKRLNALKADVNEFTVHSFGKGQEMNYLYTFGAANCTAVAGYCRTSGIGFLAHFSPRYEDIAGAFRQIEWKIKKLGGNGLAHMTLTIAGGRVSNSASLANALSVYRELAQTYNTSYKGERRLHLGLTYSIIMENGKIEIFAN